MTPDLSYETVLEVVKRWTPQQRISLTRALIDTLRSLPSEQKKPTIEELIGAARGEGAPPTDEQVREWVDEQRMRKYGGGAGA